MTVCKLDTNVLHPMRAKLSHASFPLYVGINSRASYTTPQIVIGFCIPPNLVHDEHYHRLTVQ